MLNLLDELMREVVLGGTSLLNAAQVRFQPPDAQLRSDVVSLNQMVLDFYLVELRENRKLRSNERLETVQDGFVFLEQAPERVDCHYLVSAWSPAQIAPGIEPTVDEHALLYESMTALILASPFTPARVYAPADPRLAQWPAAFRDFELPTEAVTPEGFGKLSEFWTTMGQDARWKPVIHLVVTIPIALVKEMAGALVTSAIGVYQHGSDASASEAWISVGGHVRAPGSGGSQDVESAWVRIETEPGGVPVGFATTDADGRFIFERLAPGTYRIRTGATGHGPIDRVVDIPSETGEYDLQFP
jgi:hypothetical protein